MLAYVACFDISDDAIRRNVGRRLEHFGHRVQRSVFEISVDSPDELEKLRLELLDWIDEEGVDDVRFYPLCRECRRKAQDANGLRIAEFPAAVIV